MIAHRITNLPPERTRFVGREAQLRQLDDLFRSGRRLVTIMGAPGMGKTRLAAHYSSQCLLKDSRMFSAAWFCDLAEARSVDGIISSVSATLNIPLLEGRTAETSVTQLAHALAGHGTILLVLDNCEQITEHAAVTIDRWLDTAPDVRFLVTSRERLRLGGETCLELEPLSETEAVDLFFERARERCFDFGDGTLERETVADLVARLDNIPLAIELAAARVAIMPPATLLNRLEQRFNVLRGARRDVCSRQNSLDSAIEWSWNLLTQWEQAALAQFSTFRGGCSLEAAEAVIDLTGFPAAPPVAEVAESLVDQSLLRTETEGAEIRFSLFESIRAFAALKLEYSGELGGTEQRHASYFLTQGESWKEGFAGPHVVGFRRQLCREADNLFEIHRRFFHSHPETAVQAVILLDAALSGNQSVEKRHALHAATAEVAEASVGPRLKAQLLLVLGETQRQLGMGETAHASFHTALDLAQECQDPRLAGQALLQLGLVSLEQGKLEPAVASFKCALAPAQEADDPALESAILIQLGHAQLHRAKKEAVQHLKEALAIARQIGSPHHICMSLLGIGVHVYLQGELANAEKLIEEAQDVARATGEHRPQSIATAQLAHILFDRGRPQEAEQAFSNIASAFRRVGNRRMLAFSLCSIGLIQHERCQIEKALETLGAARSLTSEIGDRLMEGVVQGHVGRIEQERRDYEAARTKMTWALERCREQGSRRDEGRVLANLGILEIEAGQVEQARMLLSQAIALAEGLEERETQVLALAFLGAAEILADHTNQAACTFEKARRTLSPMGLAGLLGTLNLLEGFLDIAKARCLRPADCDPHLEAARRRLFKGLTKKPANEQHPDGVPAVTEIFFHARVAYRMLRASLAQLEPARVAGLPDGSAPGVQQTTVQVEAAGCLLVHPKCFWFQVSDSARVDLSRSPLSRRLLLELVQHRMRSAGEGLSVYDLMEVGWPGQTMSVESGTSRVYVGIRKLRKLGLESLLLTQETGYLLDPDITVVWGDPGD